MSLNLIETLKFDPSLAPCKHILVAGVIRHSPCPVFLFPQSVRLFRPRAEPVVRRPIRSGAELSCQFARGECFS